MESKGSTLGNPWITPAENFNYTSRDDFLLPYHLMCVACMCLYVHGFVLDVATIQCYLILVIYFSPQSFIILAVGLNLTYFLHIVREMSVYSIV